MRSRRSPRIDMTNKNPGQENPGRGYSPTVANLVAARAAAVAVAATATAARALARLSFVHLEGASLKVLAIERLHGAGSVCVRHLDEAETTGSACVAIVDEGERFDGSVRREKRTYGFFGRREGQIAYK
jgi:hypothetical protein